MKIIRLLILFGLLFSYNTFCQSPSFKTYLNPVIPGDHPDPTLTKVGNYFYTSGSSFNPTPRIYRSTDLVHWEVIAQPVSATWTEYGDSPGGGIWGGHMVYYNNKYWHFFGRGGGSMYFVTADQPEGPWSNPPVKMKVPAGMTSGLGVDNSIFIDEDTGKWYLLTKAGQPNNYIVELGQDGQPNGDILDLTWLNPNSEGNPYGWAEGPVMWKHNGYYYYSFAQHLVGQQYVMRSDTLTDEKSAWTIIGTNIFKGSPTVFTTPNHISPAVELEDGTSWVIAHSYYNTNWYAQGRQGLLCQLKYNDEGFPFLQFPSADAVPAPNLPGSGISWAVPKSDFFSSSKLKPDWSFLGYISQGTYSLDVREGWLYLEPFGGTNTIIQNDGEHSYSIITRVDFEPSKSTDEAGLWIFNGPETHYVKLFSTINGNDKKIVFSFQNTVYETTDTIGAPVWLKIIRNEHVMSGFYSPDGNTWIQVGEDINAKDIDIEQAQFNSFTGNQQGLYVKGKAAYFDNYIYRDAYTKIAAQNPANRYGVSTTNSYLTNIHNDDWAMYAGVEFGNDDYKKSPKFIEISAAGTTAGGIVEVWLDSIDSGRKIAECKIDTIGSLTNYKIFKANVDSVSGSHDVYLKFKGTGTDQLFRMNWFRFLTEFDDPTVGVIDEEQTIQEYSLKQNYPNPFNPTTRIKYSVKETGYVTLKVYDIIGREVNTLFEGLRKPGNYETQFDGKDMSSGVYLCQMTAHNFLDTKKLMLIK